jgi:leucyl-tRNA---protein transferase
MPANAERIGKHQAVNNKVSMIAEHNYPKSFLTYELDKYLAKGWFRGGVMMSRSDFLCFEESLQTVINIRLPLKNHVFRKRQRRICKKITNQFQVKIRPFQACPQKDILYENHKDRFKGFLNHTLFHYLNGEEGTITGTEIFDTHEVCVYDGDKLIAFSLFDLGNNSMASILGIFHEDYATYSLGKFTMLKEIEFGQKNGFEYYYPGYILHNTPLFNYKLELGKMEFYNNQKQWQSFEMFDTFQPKSLDFEKEIQKIEHFVEMFQIPYKRITYSGFTFSYFDFDSIYYVRSPLFVLLYHNTIEGEALILEYWWETQKYVLSSVGIHVKFDLFDSIRITQAALESPTNCLDLLSYHSIIARSADLFALIPALLSISFKRKWASH